MPSNDSSHGAQPIAAALTTSSLWPLCMASNLPNATTGNAELVEAPPYLSRGAFQSSVVHLWTRTSCGLAATAPIRLRSSSDDRKAS
jgi:hypothetical protein